MVFDKVEGEIKELPTKFEVGLIRKDVEVLRMELMEKIESSSLRVESNLRAKINKLIVWIVATMMASGAIFITIAKIFFNK